MLIRSIFRVSNLRSKLLNHFHTAAASSTRKRGSKTQAAKREEKQAPTIHFNARGRISMPANGHDFRDKNLHSTNKLLKTRRNKIANEASSCAHDPCNAPSFGFQIKKLEAQATKHGICHHTEFESGATISYSHHPAPGPMLSGGTPLDILGRILKPSIKELRCWAQRLYPHSPPSPS